MGTTRKRGTLAPWDYPGEDRLKNITSLRISGGKIQLFLMGGSEAPWSVRCLKVKL